MRIGRSAAAFLRAPAARRRMAVEAGCELLRARLDTLLPASHYTRRLGRLNAAAPTAGPAEEALAAEVGHVVAVAARLMPFRARCLQQALAVRRMLARRGVPAVVHLGVARDGSARDSHAWVTSGRRVVSGDTDLGRYVVIGTFS